MDNKKRDISALRHIAAYCDEITASIERHNLTLDKVIADTVYKNALSMSILQIGELVNVLSQNFRVAHDTMPWREIKRMRDKAAHHYGEFDVNTLWETVNEDIEPLKSYCLKCIEELEA
jgi:uncharacterized protein with HEPN domain